MHHENTKGRPDGGEIMIPIAGRPRRPTRPGPFRQAAARLVRLLTRLSLLGAIIAAPAAARTGDTASDASDGRPLTVAVAANVLEPMREIAAAFEQEGGGRVNLVPGSTGKLYAQILQGAPFDLFLAADEERPALLFSAGLAASLPRTYAVGRLALYSRSGEATLARLREGRYRRLAIADPQVAPYGRAAREVIDRLGLAETATPRLVMGENIGQTYAFVATGNADLGLVALSYALSPSAAGEGSYWPVPGQWHAPIRQDAVLLHPARAAAVRFLDFLGGARAREVLVRYGYQTEAEPGGQARGSATARALPDAETVE